MNNPLFLFFVFLGISSIDAHGQTNRHDDKLPVAGFSEKIAQTHRATIVDVRTPSEFEKGHLAGALNINWNDESFDEQIALLDKSAPIFLYCHSGGRSGRAYERLKEMGFEHVFDMQGGMLAWRTAELPEIHTEDYQAEGMSTEDYRNLVQSDGLVLVDFYADWCIPCIKMKPYFARIEKEMSDQLTLIQINIDENRKISKELGVKALPALMLYENGEQTWQHQGYLDEEAIRKRIP